MTNLSFLRRWSMAWLTAALAVVALGGPAASTKAAEKPNIIFILTDDQRWDQMSCAGHPYLKTPHLDRLAAEGALFENMFVTTSLCSPARASYLSGLYANTHGVSNNFTDYPRDLPSFPRQLQSSGYKTAYIGKWHMGEEDDSPRPDFDYWASHRGQGKYFDTEFNINNERRVLKGYYTTAVTDLALNWLGKQGGDEPFLLCLGHKAPHTPFTPEPKYAGQHADVRVGYPRSAFNLGAKPDWVKQRLDTWHGIYGPLYGFRPQFPDRSAAGVVAFENFVKGYTNSIQSVDDSMGRIYAALEKSGQLEKTVIIFAGDNGSFLGEHGMTDKRAMHEPSIRVPLIVRYPELIKPGTKVSEQVLNIDVAPSVVELAGAKPLPKVHGRSWVPLLKGENADWRDAWYYEYNYEVQFPYTPNVRGVRTSDWKYIRYPHGDGGPDRHRAELYHLTTDPGELHNLAQIPDYADKVSELSRRLDELIAETGGRSDKVMPIDEGIKTELPDANIR